MFASYSYYVFVYIAKAILNTAGGVIMDDLTNILRAWIMIFALILFLVSIFAYYRTRHKRVLIVSVAFAIFFVKGALLSIGLANPEIEDFNNSGIGEFRDLLILA